MSKNLRQQIVLNPKYPAEYDHLRYIGKRPIHNVFTMSAMGNILVLKGEYNNIPISECKDYTVKEGTITYDNKEEKVFIIEWDYPTSCLS